MKLGRLFVLACLGFEITASTLGRHRVTQTVRSEKRALQDIVTYDGLSLSIYGQRLVIYSGEFHGFRLPVPSLWLDIFQKMRALGYNAASIYWDWALLEGQQGSYTATGVFDVALFLQAAKQAGVFIIARPGPYINAEVSGGGFPGWLSRSPAHLRTNETGFLDAQANYISSIGKTIAEQQITNGGPVILFQPENEYLNGFASGYSPNPYYVQDVEDAWRGAGIVMPYTDNYGGNFATPGSGIGAIDLYGGDSYPNGFDCSNPYNWQSNKAPTNEYSSARSGSTTTPPMIPEFQGGSYDTWGGAGFDNCAILTNEDFEKVFYKNNFASGLKIVSLYMTYGGTNWGNLGFPLGYTSYDYGAAISENREIARAKYSEAKLIANFWHASPAYLTSSPTPNTGVSGTDLSCIPVVDSQSHTTFYVIRHNGQTEGTTTFTFNFNAGGGTEITVPQIQGELTLVPKDSKIYLSNYTIGTYDLVYSSAEIFTHQSYSTYSVGVFYGGLGEVHELAFTGAPNAKVISGSGVTIKQINGNTVINWQAAYDTRSIVQINSDLYIYLTDRNSAYNYWVTYLPADSSDPLGTFSTALPVILNGGYLIRNATLSGTSLYVTGDLNATTTIEVIGAPSTVSSLYFNGQEVQTTSGSAPLLAGSVEYNSPTINLPDLTALNWTSIDSLPELSSSYDDSLWTSADLTYTNNTNAPKLQTPTSLYAADYGYNTGALFYRGHFTATGSESSLNMEFAGGEAFSAAVWLGSTYIATFVGNKGDQTQTVGWGFPSVTAGTSYVLNVLIDQTGLEESQTQGADFMKAPRGILSYNIKGLASNAITWKVTGNLHGEAYVDKTRGPLNEGGLFAERQGYHLPNPPSDNWATSSPLTGTTAPGVTFYTAPFDLDLPAGYDVPLYFNFPGILDTDDYRCQLYINGWQFGKYVRNLGPQSSFPVPEGILNYQGTNYIAISLWSQSVAGNKLESLSLSNSTPVQSGFGTVNLVDSPAYSPRDGAY